MSLSEKILPFDPTDDQQLQAAPFTRDDAEVRWEWESLLKSGPQALTLEDLRALTVEQFPNSVHRKKIYDGLMHWVSALLGVIPHFTLYVDGGFLTRKPRPKDVDVVAFLHPSDIECLSTSDIQELERLFDRNAMIAAHLVDVYPERNDDPEREAYWQEQFGKRYDRRTPKGFAVIEVSA